MKTLNQVGSLISSLQGNKILKKISKKKDQGFYKNELEFKEALKANLLDVTAAQNQPLYVPYPITSGLAHSEIHNSNIDEILLDLEVLFEEISYLFSKIKSHEVFFERSVNEAEVLIKKIEQNLESAKIESSFDNNFNKVFHNTFVDASNKVDSTNLEAREFYNDLILNKRTTLENLCNIDIKQSKLSLPKFSSQRVDIAEVKIQTTETTVSDYNITFPGNDISNITNPGFLSSWSHAVLTKKQLKDPAKLVLVLDFGDIKEFNSITLNPNTNEPIFLDEIYTVDSLGIKHNFEIEKGILSESKTFLFSKSFAKAIYVSFKQDRNKVITHNPTEQVSLAELQRDPTLPLTIDTISGQIKESIKDPSVKNILGLQQISLNDSELVYYYSFSFTSIEVTNDDFKNKGIYVAKPESFNSLRNLGLYVKDLIPTSKHWQSSLDMPAGSIEYVLFKKDYNKNNKLVKTTTFPVLPVGTDIITNERIHFEESPIRSLRFIGHKQDGDGSNIELYRNGELLIRGVDWKFSKRQSISPADHMLLTTEKRTIVELTQSQDQISNGVYYAKYIPRFILEPEAVVIDNGARFLENCSLVIPNIIHGQEIDRSDIYVHVMIRNHTESSIQSPYVDYYRLAGKEE